MRTVPKRHICGEIVHLGEDGYHHRFDREGELPPMLTCPLCHEALEDDWFRPLYKVEPMSRQMMEVTISGDRSCSNCWGYSFTVKDVNVPVLDSEGNEIEGEVIHMYYVICTNCLEETQGYVSPGYVGYCRRKDYEDYGLSYLSLSEALGIAKHRPRGERSEADNLEALGF